MAIEEKEYELLSYPKKINKYKKNYSNGNKRLKVNWKNRKSLGFTFELVVRDESTYMRIDKFIWNSPKNYRKILELLRLKYGLEYR